jgi:primosomal protein N' (replication factor Y)
VLLLDGERMLARESLRVAEDCLRWWTNAIALAAPGAPSILVGVGGALASALATWRIPDYAGRELVDRRRLRFPPAVRVATVTGGAASVDTALKALPIGDHVDVLGPVDVEATASGAPSVRAIVRFDLGQGAAVASALRAEVIRNATTRRKRVPANGRPALPTLKVRFDDPEPFDL